MKSLGKFQFRTRLVFSLILFSFLFSACSDGGGGAPVNTSFGNTLPPATGPGDVENFFPTDLGSSWNYFASTTDTFAGTTSNHMDSVTVTGTKIIGGQIASVFLESNPSGSGIPVEGYYYKNAGGLAFLGTNDVTDTITAAIVPYIVGLFPATPGVVAHFDKYGIDFGVDLDDDGINESMNLTLTSTIVGFEPINIGIGSFARTLRAREDVTGTVVLSDLKFGIPFALAQTRWLAPGIGVLKTNQDLTVQPIVTSETLEARGYTINGVEHGFGLPFTVEGNLPTNLLPFSDPPALATDGQNYFAASEGAGGLVGRLFDTKGVSIGSISVAAGTGSFLPVAAYDGANYWLLYSPYSEGTSGSIDTCFAKRVSPTGTLIDTTAINLVTVGGTYSSISSKAFAFGSSNGLLAYSTFNLTTNQHELHGVLVNPDGSVVGTGTFPIATDDSTHLNPAVAFDGTNFFVVWEQMPSSGATVRKIVGVRISTNGTVLDSSPVTISDAPNGQSYPAVAFDGTNYLVVWLDLRNQTEMIGPLYPDVYGARVSTTNILLDGPSTTGGFAINGGGTVGRESPKVAFLGTEYLVTWLSPGYAITGSLGVQATRVSTDGTLPSGANMAISVSGPPSADTGSQLTFPMVAYGSLHAAVIWFDNQNPKALVGASFFPF